MTLLNNLRKKVRSRKAERELYIQSKFQEIKRNLRSLTETQDFTYTLNQSAPEILPVTVPKVPGARSLFGSSNPPLLPRIPSCLDLVSQLPDKPMSKFTRLTRGDLVGKFQGHTTDQVRKLLQEHVGGVIMIDEAYNLCTSAQDDFGKELLTEIINFMTTWPDKIIFIFAGYRKEMEESVLKFQPGLARRFKWTFEIEDYTSEEINKIFQQQVKACVGELDDTTVSELSKFFKDNVAKFPHFGGDTERLCDFVKEQYYEQNWITALDDNVVGFEQLFGKIKFSCIVSAFKQYLEHSVKEKEEARRKKEEKESFDKVKHMYL